MSVHEGIKKTIVSAIIAEGSKGLGIAAIQYFALMTRNLIQNYQTILRGCCFM
jgi:hypothetical protein